MTTRYEITAIQRSAEPFSSLFSVEFDTSSHASQAIIGVLDYKTSELFSQQIDAVAVLIDEDEHITVAQFS